MPTWWCNAQLQNRAVLPSTCPVSLVSWSQCPWTSACSCVERRLCRADSKIQTICCGPMTAMAGGLRKLMVRAAPRHCGLAVSWHGCDTVVHPLPPASKRATTAATKAVCAGSTSDFNPDARMCSTESTTSSILESLDRSCVPCLCPIQKCSPRTSQRDIDLPRVRSECPGVSGNVRECPGTSGQVSGMSGQGSARAVINLLLLSAANEWDLETCMFLSQLLRSLQRNLKK